MSENTVKIRLKFGQSEIEYEGPSSFLQNDLSALMKEMANSYKDHYVPPTTDPSSFHKEITEPNDKSGMDFSMDMIASRMGKNTGSNLILAACAYLTLVKQKTKFSRQDIINEMKNATSYYRESMLGGNLTTALERLLKNKHLNQVSSGNYALSAAKKAEMENLLAKD